MGKRKGNPHGLTDRQIDILRLAATGMSNLEIGHTIYIVEKGVADHLRLAYRKMGVISQQNGTSRVEAILMGIREGWIPFDPSEKMIEDGAARIYAKLYLEEVSPENMAEFYLEPEALQDSMRELSRAAFGIEET